jgi:hypothetical protein
MLIMPCRASASRCRVQVTSNVRLAKNSMCALPLKTRAPEPNCVNAFSHRAGRVCVRNEVQSCRLRQERCARNLGQTNADLRPKESDLRRIASSGMRTTQQPANAASPGSRRKTGARALGSPMPRAASSWHPSACGERNQYATRSRQA